MAENFGLGRYNGNKNKKRPGVAGPFPFWEVT